ncbi:NAD-dependent epimerase/dehydratase family protein [Streptosporangium sp. NPDC051023]|uniref:NAD-dependent epimerase/dehydratase family protein n=1 Tax=Streptosporangium sp. NPDC051023 TaxID=3155410 RepID=UPI00344FCEF4
MKIVVTGGAGFIGANLCEELSRRPDVSQILVLDDLSSGSLANLRNTRADFVHGNILDRSLLKEVMSGADAAVHLAARPSVAMSVDDPEGSHEVNATGTLRVLEACRAEGAYAVVASSCAVYGDSAENPKHEDLPTRPLSPYGASKLATEAYTLSYAASFGMRALALRFFNVYGPFQPADHAYAAVVPAFVDAALRGDPLRVHGDGLQTRDFTFAETVVAVLVDAVMREVTSETPVNVAHGIQVSLLELARELSGVLGRPLEIRHEPPRKGDIRDSRASCDRLRLLFPDIVPVSLELGLRRTVDWFEQTVTTNVRRSQ